jgi:hypothetical protein
VAARRLLLVLAVAALAAQAASAAEPGWRRADNERALAIGLTVADAGPGWHEAAPRRSPYTVDAGSIMGSSPGVGCLGQDAPTRAETDLVVSGASMSTLARAPDTLTSFVLLYKTPALARAQLPGPAAAAGLRRCVAGELSQSVGGMLGGGAVSVAPLALRTGPPLAASYRLVARLPTGPLYVDLVLQQDGRGVVETIVLSAAAPPPAALERRVTGIAAARLARYAA